MNYQKELQDYVDTLVSRDASDIHLMVNTKPIFRVYRELTPFIQKDILTKDDIISFLKIITNGQHESGADIYEKKHLLFSYQHQTTTGKKVNFRVTAYLERGSISIAMRLIKDKIFTIEELNLPPILKNFMLEKSGLFLVVGPAGNGKSTSLATMLQYCNDNYRKHILTIEDPIEFIFHNNKSIITQREVPSDAETFRQGLDSALRADADILMIGEMRETATMRSVMTAAEVGHLALSTVHANSASSTINRIIDSFPETQQRQISHQLAFSLVGICSIRLIKRKSGGLIPACEILINTSAVANLIRENRVTSINTAIQTGRGEGMISLEHSLAELVKKDEIALESAQIYADDNKILMKYL